LRKSGQLEDREGDANIIFEMDLRKVACEEGRWMKMVQDRVEWRTSILATLEFWVLLTIVHYSVSQVSIISKWKI
jgi:hypothetical protein